MANKEVIVAVRGGIATVIKQPEGLDVHIRDYDVPRELCSPDVDIYTDEDHYEYVFACSCCS